MAAITTSSLIRFQNNDACYFKVYNEKSKKIKSIVGKNQSGTLSVSDWPFYWLGLQKSAIALKLEINKSIIMDIPEPLQDQMVLSTNGVIIFTFSMNAQVKSDLIC